MIKSSRKSWQLLLDKIREVCKENPDWVLLRLFLLSKSHAMHPAPQRPQHKRMRIFYFLSLRAVDSAANTAPVCAGAAPESICFQPPVGTGALLLLFPTSGRHAERKERARVSAAHNEITLPHRLIQQRGLVAWHHQNRHPHRILIEFRMYTRTANLPNRNNCGSQPRFPSC